MSVYHLTEGPKFKVAGYIVNFDAVTHKMQFALHRTYYRRRPSFGREHVII
jgi:hypothetical protein